MFIADSVENPVLVLNSVPDGDAVFLNEPAASGPVNGLGCGCQWFNDAVVTGLEPVAATVPMPSSHQSSRLHRERSAYRFERAPVS